MRPFGELATLAVIEAPSDAETVFGGRTRGWNAVGSLWLAMDPRRVEEAAPASPGVARDTAAPARLRERCTAESWPHPAAVRGRRLTLNEDHWRIVAREAVGKARVRLHLIKE